MSTLQRWSLLWVVIAAVACAPRGTGPVAPSPSSAALAVEPVDWGKRGTEPLAVPASTKHVQLVITGGATRDEHYAWLIANGTDVIGVFRASSSEVADVIGAAAGAARVAVASPLQTASFVAIGTIYAPPPPPPPHGKPPFFPPIYVEDVMRLAWNVSHTAEIEGDRLSAAGAAQQ